MRTSVRAWVLVVTALLAVISVLDLRGGVPQSSAAPTGVAAPTPTVTTRVEEQVSGGAVRMELLQQTGMPEKDSDVPSWIASCTGSGRTVGACVSTALSSLPLRDAVDLDATIISVLPTLGGGCHGPTHELGQRAYRELKDPYVAVMAGSDVCEEGFYHGVFEAWGAAVGSEGIQKESDLCTRITAALSKSICAHGFGHALWFAKHDTKGALAACRVLPKDDLQGCVSGVTMSFVQDDEVSFASPEEVLKFCQDYPDDVRDGCITEAAGLLLRVLGTPQKVLLACPTLKPIKGVRRCLLAAGMQLPFAVNLRFDEVRSACDAALHPEDCFFGAVKELQLRPSNEANKLMQKICDYSPTSCTEEEPGIADGPA